MVGMEPSKKILIIAGPNGAGKTTFAREFLVNEADCPTFVNADLLAAGLNPLQPERETFRAGRMMLEMIEDYVRRGASFAFETTLSGRGYARMIPRWQAEGYRVRLYFLRLPDPEIAVSRVRNRVIEGGHDIPEETIRRRFDAGWRNFELLYKDLVDEWALLSGAGTSPVLIERGPTAVADDQTTHRQTFQERRRPYDFDGALAAMRRAAVKARQRAIALTGSVPTWRDGETVYDTEVSGGGPPPPHLDSRLRGNDGKEHPHSRDVDGAEAALRRAAIKARRRAIALTGSVPTWRDGKVVYDTEV